MTEFKTVIDKGFLSITDYKLQMLLGKDERAFYSYMSSFLVNAIDDFQNACFNDLSYSQIEDANTYLPYYGFDNDLTHKEIRILALGIAINWYKKELDDVTQFRLHLSEKNFKTMSEQANLSKRLERLEELKEEWYDAITDYQLGYIKGSGVSFFNGGG